jgi:hypothetical protein
MELRIIVIVNNFIKLKIEMISTKTNTRVTTQPGRQKNMFTIIMIIYISTKMNTL